MCFYKINYNDKVKIATKDIVCYKAVELREKQECFRSFYKKEIQHLDELLKSKLDIDTYFYSVDIGLHSLKNIGRSKLWRFNSNSFWSKGCSYMVKCIIPKGSQYLENDSEYVSNQIIMKEILFEFKVGNKLVRKFSDYNQFLEWKKQHPKLASKLNFQ